MSEFKTLPLSDATDKATRNMETSNAAMANMETLFSEAVASISRYNAARAAYLELHSEAIDSVEWASTVAGDIVATHTDELALPEIPLPVLEVPDPPQPPVAEAAVAVSTRPGLRRAA